MASGGGHADDVLLERAPGLVHGERGQPLHLGVGRDHRDPHPFGLAHRPGRRLGGGDRVAVVRQHDHLCGAARRHGVDDVAGRGPPRSGPDDRGARLHEQVAEPGSCRDGHHRAARRGSWSRSSRRTCSAKWVTRTRYGRPASMPASSAAPTSSTCTWTFHKPVTAHDHQRVPERRQGRPQHRDRSSSASSRNITSYDGPSGVRSPVGSGTGIAWAPEPVLAGDRPMTGQHRLRRRRARRTGLVRPRRPPRPASASRAGRG